MSQPFFSDSSHLCRKISSRSARNSLYRLERWEKFASSLLESALLGDGSMLKRILSDLDERVIGELLDNFKSNGLECLAGGAFWSCDRDGEAAVTAFSNVTV